MTFTLSELLQIVGVVAIVFGAWSFYRGYAWGWDDAHVAMGKPVRRKEAA